MFREVSIYRFNVSSDALEGVAPIEILADYGGHGVKRKLRQFHYLIDAPNFNFHRENYFNCWYCPESSAALVFAKIISRKE